MYALRLVSAMVLSALDRLGVLHSNITTSSNPSTLTSNFVGMVVANLTVAFSFSTDHPSTDALDPRKWRRIEKELYLHTAQRSAWLYIALAEEKELTANDLVISDIRLGKQHPGTGLDNSWESRPGDIWLLKSNYLGDSHSAVTGVDVLFGVDAVDPRSEWALIHPPLHLNAQPGVPVASLSIRYGKPKTRPDGPRTALRVREDGTFKIVQISDTHMVTGVGVCKDAMNAGGQPLPESEADPLTIDFLRGVLDVEKPDLVALTGDQLHHDNLDSQSALLKLVAPMIERSIPYAVVFGNHDDEGTYALSRTAQMTLLQDLPFSLCQPGPEQIDGVGNYYLQVFDHAPSRLPVSTFYFLDSHGQLPSNIPYEGYDWVKQSQIDWFTFTSQALRKAREKDDKRSGLHLSLAFLHIPFPEYGDCDLLIQGGHRGEPTEGPKFNSHLYDALAEEGVAAVGCGHDHVNDFCGLRPQQDNTSQLGPWLCYGGGSGFGGYGSYGGKRYHRRVRVWELDTTTGGIRTWKRVEYDGKRVDEVVLVEHAAVVPPPSRLIEVKAV